MARPKKRRTDEKVCILSSSRVVQGVFQAKNRVGI